jgi:hypothetical protein
MESFQNAAVLGASFCLLLFVPGCERSPVNSPPTSAPNVQLEQPPPPTKLFIRTAFRFDYPATWTVDEKDKDYDPDHMFTIDASVGGMVTVVIFDAVIDPAKTLSTNVKMQEKNIPGATKTEFKQWGRYDGAGMTLQGKVLGVAKSTYRIFVFNASEKTFLITELIPDDEEQQLAPGFRAVEETFQVEK